MRPLTLTCIGDIYMCIHMSSDVYLFAPPEPERYTRRGRPVLYDREKASRILTTIANGGLYKHALEAEGMDRARWMRWCIQVPDLLKSMEVARKMQAAAFIDRAHEIADNVVEDPNAIAKAKLQCDQARWTAARIDPNNWGSKREVAIVGDADRPVSIAVIPATLPPARWAEQVALYQGGALPAPDPLPEADADAAVAAVKPYGLAENAGGSLNWSAEELEAAGEVECTEDA